MTHPKRREAGADRLAEKIERLQASRVAMKRANTTYRRDNKTALNAMTADQRDHAVPFPSYTLANFGTTIRNAKKRLANANKRLAGLDRRPRGSRPPPRPRAPGR